MSMSMLHSNIHRDLGNPGYFIQVEGTTRKRKEEQVQGKNSR